MSKSEKKNKLDHSVVMWGGDVNLGRRQHYLVHEFDGRVLPNELLHTADLAIVNLECVVATGGQLGVAKGERSPYYFRARPEMLRLLNDAKIGLVATANNHSGDYGPQALLEQAGWLNAEGIGHAGSGANREAAFSPAYRQAGAYTVALFSIDATMRSFAAGETTPGHAFLSLSDPAAWFAALAPRIQQARKRADVVFVAVHWGPNLATAPAADEIACGHALIDAGADAVLGASAHVLQGVEIYRGRPIIHDAGDLLFDAVTRSNEDSGLFALEFDADGVHGVQFTPLAGDFGRTARRVGEDAKQASERFIALCDALSSGGRGLWKMKADGSCKLKLSPPDREHAAAPVRTMRPEWSVAAVPQDAVLAQPLTFGPLRLLGMRACTGEKNAPNLVFVDSYWSLIEPTSQDWRLDLRATAAGVKPAVDWGRSFDHDPCDWMWPTSQWEPGRIYHDRISLRPSGVLPKTAATLQLQARAVSAAERPALVSLPRRIEWTPPQNIPSGGESWPVYKLLPLDQLPPDADDPDVAWTADQLRAVTGGRWIVQPPPGWGVQVVTNLRGQVKSLQVPGLYVAHDYDTLWAHERLSVRGPNSYDRHRFLPELSPKLAGGLVKHDVQGLDPSFPRLQVDDPVKAMIELGATARQRMRGRVVAVTGSSGKSTVSAMVSHVFGADMRVRASVDNYNSRVGIMHTLANAPRATDMVVLETAISAINARNFQFIKLARPDVAVITNIGDSHMKPGETTFDVARRKANIFQGMVPGGCAVICADAEHAEFIVSKARERGLHVLTYGLAENADLQLTSYEPATGEVRVSDHTQGTTQRYRIGAPGLHMAVNSLVCMAVAKALDLPFTSQRLSSFEPLGGRGQAVFGRVGAAEIKIIDESYNANPLSMVASLQCFGQGSVSGRKVLVLGDMLELGDRTKELHLELASVIARCSPAMVFLRGENMEQLLRPLLGVHKLPHAKHFSTLAELERALAAELKHGDSVLVKGSNGMQLWKWVEKVAGAAKKPLSPQPSLPSNTTNSQEYA